MIEAKYYLSEADKIVQCNLCPHYCRINEHNLGLCRGKKNENGILYAINYGQSVAVHLDPIEKKPLYHYFPGSQILSLGANSCNLKCSFCQNYEISQMDCKTEFISPDQLLSLCLREQFRQVAFTYTEPFTWYEYVFDCAKLLKNNGIRIVLVTNGYINAKPLNELLPLIDAMNIDLKSMDDDFYRKICGGSLEPVLDNIKTVFSKCHLELTFLLIPGLNDKDEIITKLSKFISSLSCEIPLHISRYYPRWKAAQPSTTLTALIKAKYIAEKKLHYVYIGNVNENGLADTLCPSCGEKLIIRDVFKSDVSGMQGENCIHCGKLVYGKFNG